MEIITLKESMDRSLLLMIEVIVMITVCMAIAGMAIYLAGIAWFCLEEKRQQPRRRVKQAPEPTETDDYGLLAGLAATNSSPSLRRAKDVRRQAA